VSTAFVNPNQPITEEIIYDCHIGTRGRFDQLGWKHVRFDLELDNIRVSPNLLYILHLPETVGCICADLHALIFRMFRYRFNPNYRCCKMFRIVAEHVHAVEVRRGESRKEIWSKYVNMYLSPDRALVTNIMNIILVLTYYT